MRIGTMILFVFSGMVVFSFLILLVNGLRLSHSMDTLLRKIGILMKRIDRPKE